MHCPMCHTTDTKVIETRILQNGLSIRRRRRCENCDKRFTTYENFDLQLPAIVKADGRRENFDREKIERGLTKACQKRPISIDQISGLIDHIEKRLTDSTLKEINSNELGNFIMDELYKLDPVSFVRFASFYWEFSDIESFVSHLEKNTLFVNSRNKPLHSGFLSESTKQ